MNQLTDQRQLSSGSGEFDRWQATLQRDRRFDGTFVYAVRSTGIYCRPSCPSRRPRRDQVLFFDDFNAAEVAGFRACRRCHPDETPREIAMVKRAHRFIEEHLDETVTLSTLGEICGVSPFYLQRTFKRITGLSPRQYIQERRMGRLKAELRNGSDVTTALYDAGFSSSSRLYEAGADRLGMTPNAYKRGGLGLDITFTIVDCPLGRLLVGTTRQGVCAVSLGDSDDVLEETLRQEYPAARIRRGEPSGTDWVDAIANSINGHALPADLPIDVQATAFQWRVWSYLRTIPSGETRSYGEVARALEQPRAARAVAQACASNPVALIVPCHRVVRGDGDAGGYRWGTARKRALLERERQVRPDTQSSFE